MSKQKVEITFVGMLFLTNTWQFFRSYKLEQLEFKLCTRNDWNLETLPWLLLTFDQGGLHVF